ncbi:MAG: putative sugar nucleotidyl transferase [Singulisphaera sp.]
MRLCLVEDNAVAGLEPLTLTRPVFDLLLGASPLGVKIARALGVGTGPQRRATVVRPFLAPVCRAADPHAVVNDLDWLARSPTYVANGRWVPPAHFTPPDDSASWLGTCQGRPACALVGPEAAVTLHPGSVDAWFDALTHRLPRRAGAPGSTALGPGHPQRRPLERDFEAAGRHGISNRHLATAAVVGPARLLAIHEAARVDPYTVFDTTGGPITVEAGAWIQPFTRIEGPCYVGRDTHLFRANLRGGVSLGPTCRIGGEVEASIVHGHTNKYHEGFLGHAYVGEWVNLGALTSNSDLRNDYGEVRVPLGGDPVATGLAKVGCFIGDHTRTGLCSQLNTGTAIGVMCNILPAGLLLPKHVPSFAAVCYGHVELKYGLEELFATARVVMGRRGREFDGVQEQLYAGLFERTRLERQRALQKTHDHRTDRWPVHSARL